LEAWLKWALAFCRISDLAHARRNLSNVRRDIEETDPELARRTLEDHSKHFFETLTG
jgi:hypothetical protein